MYTAGITNKVSTKENINPPTITVPSGLRLVAAAPILIAIGSAPNAVAKLVINIGRNLCDAATSTASFNSKPAALFLLANSTIKIPFLVTSPINIIIPISENIFRVCPKSHKNINAPAIAKGTVIMIIKGSLKLSNCAASTK